MSTSLVTRDKSESKKKGMLAGAAWGGTMVLFALGAPWLGVAAVGGSVFLTYKWFMFRAKRGMRF
jgi:hypothetical protein